MTLGFTRSAEARFVPVWASDFNAHAAKTYNANFGEHCVVGDICSILETRSDEIPAADIVIGGPPCQGFSLLNKQRKSDPRKQLWRPFLDVGIDRRSPVSRELWSRRGTFAYSGALRSVTITPGQRLSEMLQSSRSRVDGEHSRLAGRLDD